VPIKPIQGVHTLDETNLQKAWAVLQARGEKPKSIVPTNDTTSFNGEDRTLL
jgi:hypothetical protein